jgi:CheY-like chemotaxis protein
MTSRKILLVDDSETVLLIEKLILKKEPYELATAKNGKDGIAKAHEFRPDLILMDVVMPEMNGFDAVRKLRQDIATHAIPIVMVTTRAEAESMEAGYASGCSDYITKPIDSVELLAKVRAILSA